MKGLTFLFFTVLYLIPNICFSSLVLAQKSEQENCEDQGTPLSVDTLGPFNSDECLTVLEQAKQNLPENYFIAYAIVDRLARANGLDKKPWRIIIKPDSAVAAYSEYNSDYNLIALNQSVLDVLEPSAIACVISREMGHNVKQHLGYGPLEQEKARLEEIKRLEREQLIAEQDAQTQALLGGAAAVGLQEGANALGGTAGQVLSIFGAFGAIEGGASQQNTQNGKFYLFGFNLRPCG